MGNEVGMLNTAERQFRAMAQASVAVDQDEIAALRHLALSGGLDGEIKVSCSDLAGELDVSNQTASRRLQRLDDADLLTREFVSDGQWVAVTDEGERTLRREYETYRRLFESDPAVTVRGRVTDGMGEGRHYISLSGYMRQFVDKLGYEPFPGTLNLTLDEESVRRRSRLEAIDAVPIDGWEDEDRTYGPAVCYPARVEAEGGTYERAHAIVPERTHHDEDNLELIAPEKLRDVISLSDDEWIDVTISGGDGE